MRKGTFFTPPSLNGGEAGSLRPINYKHCHFPLGVVWRVISKFVLLCTLSLGESVCGGVRLCPCCVLCHLRELALPGNR